MIPQQYSMVDPMVWESGNEASLELKMTVTDISSH